MTIEEKKAIFQKQLIEYCNEKVGIDRVGKYEYGRGHKKIDFKKYFLIIEIKESDRMIIVNSYKKLCSIVEKLDNSLFESKKIPAVLYVVNKDELDYMIEKHTKE